MSFPIVSAVTAGFLIVLQQLLMLSVGMYRVKVKRGVGFGDDANLERLIRQHGNLTENAAIFVVVLALLELATGPTIAVSGLAAGFVVARLAHMAGFSSLAGSHLAEGSKLFLLLRSAGATASALVSIAAGALLVWAGLGQ